MLREHLDPVKLSGEDPQRQLASYMRQRRVILAAMGVIYFADVAVTVFVLLAFPQTFWETNRVSAGIMSAGGVLTWVAFKAILYAVVIANLTLLYMTVCRTAGTHSARRGVVQLYVLAEIVLLGSLQLFYGMVLVHNLVTVATGLAA